MKCEDENANTNMCSYTYHKVLCAIRVMTMMMLIIVITLHSWDRKESSSSIGICVMTMLGIAIFDCGPPRAYRDSLPHILVCVYNMCVRVALAKILCRTWAAGERARVCDLCARVVHEKRARACAVLDSGASLFFFWPAVESD